MKCFISRYLVMDLYGHHTTLTAYRATACASIISILSLQYN